MVVRHAVRGAYARHLVGSKSSSSIGRATCFGLRDSRAMQISFAVVVLLVLLCTVQDASSLGAGHWPSLFTATMVHSGLLPFLVGEPVHWRCIILPDRTGLDLCLDATTVNAATQAALQRAQARERLAYSM